jgi:hypothetical protein
MTTRCVDGPRRASSWPRRRTPCSRLGSRWEGAMTAGPSPYRRPRGRPERPGLAGFRPSLRNGRGSTPFASARVQCRPCFAPTAAVRRLRGLTTPAVHCTKQPTQTLLLTPKCERLTPPTRDNRSGRPAAARASDAITPASLRRKQQSEVARAGPSRLDQRTSGSGAREMRVTVHRVGGLRSHHVGGPPGRRMSVAWVKPRRL